MKAAVSDSLLQLILILLEELIDGLQLIDYLLKDLAVKLSKLRLLYWILYDLLI